ncbi:MAG TPA: tetratricopeptide repeat protein [Polyangiaceae bacterium]|jgi:cytochrome c-type biogenesis protein CcmH/NrfG
MAKAAEDVKDSALWEAVEEATELLHEERFREAILELRAVLEEDPRNPYGFYFLGIAFFEVGEIEAARDAYTACIKLAPGHVGARVALCHVLRILGDVKGSIREGLAALSRAPADPDALHAVGLAYHARGDEKATRKYLEAYLATNPEFEVALETKALLGSIPGGKPAQAEDDD